MCVYTAVRFAKQSVYIFYRVETPTEGINFHLSAQTGLL
jgi:hypothetical protein